MAVVKCPHCGKYISSTVDKCTECGGVISAESVSDAEGHELDVVEGLEDEVETNVSRFRRMDPRQWFHLSPRRIVVLCVLAPFIVGAIYLVIADLRRARALEQRAYNRLENCTDLLFYEDFIVRFPDSKYIDEVRDRYHSMKVEHEMFFKEAAQGSRPELLAFIEKHPSSPYRVVCERRIDSLDWTDALTANTLESYTSYLAQHPEGIFMSDATDARNQQLRLVVTPEETSILRGAVDNFLSAMTARDASRIDELTRGSVNFCGMTESTGENVVEYYKQNIHKDDVLGVHFQLGGTNINKRSVSGSDALTYNLYSTATATINRSSLDSAMVVNYKVSASFSPERRITSISVTPIVDVPVEETAN